MNKVKYKCYSTAMVFASALNAVLCFKYALSCHPSGGKCYSSNPRYVPNNKRNVYAGMSTEISIGINF